jgi:hypothetical protein
MRALAECPDADALLSLRIVTREPDEGEIERMPRSVFFHD